MEVFFVEALAPLYVFNGASETKFFCVVQISEYNPCDSIGKLPILEKKSSIWIIGSKLVENNRGGHFFAIVILKLIFYLCARQARRILNIVCQTKQLTELNLSL